MVDPDGPGVLKEARAVNGDLGGGGRAGAAGSGRTRGAVEALQVHVQARRQQVTGQGHRHSVTTSRLWDTDLWGCTAGILRGSIVAMFAGSALTVRLHVDLQRVSSAVCMPA